MTDHVSVVSIACFECIKGPPIKVLNETKNIYYHQNE